VHGSALFLAVVLSIGFEASANQPGEKRTILTGGDKVHTIRFQLGQSTVIYLGFKPETVICGNKNYFNIEKIKEGITVQPLTNFSTNLTILNAGRRYLFYLTPASGQKPDGFVDVKWVSQAEALPVERLSSSVITRVVELNQKVKLGKDIELVTTREKITDGSKRHIFELELRNNSSKVIQTLSLDVFAMNGKQAMPNQTTVWELEAVQPKKVLKGRIILNEVKFKTLDLIVRYQGHDTRLTLKGAVH